MATHHLYGRTSVAGVGVPRRIDIVSANAWAADGIAAAVLATVVTDVDGSFEVELETGELIYVIGAPVAPHGPLVMGPYQPEPL